MSGINNELKLESKVFDIEKALHQVGDSPRLYRIVLNGFYTKHPLADEKIKQMVDEGKFEEAALLAHTLKGLTGNLGASKLRECCIELEKTYKNGETADPLVFAAFVEAFNEARDEALRLVEIIDMFNNTST